MLNFILYHRNLDRELLILSFKVGDYVLFNPDYISNKKAIGQIVDWKDGDKCPVVKCGSRYYSNVVPTRMDKCEPIIHLRRVYRLEGGSSQHPACNIRRHVNVVYSDNVNAVTCGLCKRTVYYKIRREKDSFEL